MVNHFKSIYFNQIVVLIKLRKLQNKTKAKKLLLYYVIIPVYSHQSHPGPKQLLPVYKITAEINCDLLQAGG